MKKKTIWKKRCGSLLAGALLTGAVALVGWQGIRSFSDAKTPAKVHRLAAESSAVSVISSSPALTSASEVESSKPSKPAKSTQKATSSKTTAAAESSSAAYDISFPLDLNAATAEELQALPGIGETLAQRIVVYREQIGGFRNLEQLLEVNGIGTVKYAEIVPMLYLPEETPDEEESLQPEEVPEESSAADMPEEAATDAAEPTEPVSFPIDLNTATREELMRIPEMTETLADAILTLRQEIRYFSSPYELLYAEGMTDQRFEKLRDFVTVLPENRP
ncbi:ComEA family DNA-binding protein [Ruminococcus sp.]